MNTARSRVHKSLRLDADLAARVTSLRSDGESEGAAYSRIIEAGVAALEGEEPGRERPLENEATAGGRVVAALESHVDTLKKQLDAMAAQLATKDAQIEALTRLTEQAQTLHAMDTAKALTDGEEAQEPAGAWARIKRFFS